MNVWRIYHHRGNRIHDEEEDAAIIAHGPASTDGGKGKTSDDANVDVEVEVEVDEGYDAFLNFIGVKDEYHSEAGGNTLTLDQGSSSENLALRKRVEELELSFSWEDIQNAILEKEIEQLRRELDEVRREKDDAMSGLRRENEIIEAQRLALEECLVEMNRSAGSLRDSTTTMSSVGDCTAADDDVGGEEDASSSIRTAAARRQLSALERENEALRSTVDTLRRSFAMLEEEKGMVEEEMNERLACREATIDRLEGALQQQQHAMRSRFSKKKKKKKGNDNGTQFHSPPAVASPDIAAGGH